MLWARIYFRNYPLMVSGVLLLVILLALRVFRGARIGRDAADVVEKQAQDAADAHSNDQQEDEAGDDRFVRYSPDLRGGGIRDEYEELLGVFGVKPGVDLKHIKNAYRNAVKNCHPDLKKNTTAAEADRFIFLTQAYDRLLNLHEEKTGER
jgi:hypothetical protein